MPCYAPVTWWKPWTWNRIESWVTTREAEFSAKDRDLAIAQMIADSDMGSHGVPMSEATAQVNQFSFVADPVVDFAARAIAIEADRRRKTYADDPNAMHGVSFRVRKVPKPDK